MKRGQLTEINLYNNGTLQTHHLDSTLKRRGNIEIHTKPPDSIVGCDNPKRVKLLKV